MTTLGILLTLASAICHATWNTISNTGGSPVLFMRAALRYSLICYFPLFIFMVVYGAPLSTTVLLCLAASGLVTGIYFFCVGKSYTHGKVSVNYPIARSFPILVLTWAAILWGQSPSPQGLVGIVFVVVGCFILPLAKFQRGPDGFCFANYFNRGSLWALFAALSTSTFSMIDKYAAVNMAEGTSLASILSRIEYVYLQNALAGITVILMMRIGGESIKVERSRKALIAGLIFLVSYGLIVLALTTDPVAYVVGFRQLSIVMGTIVSMIWIEKEFSWPRLIGVIVVFAGIIMIGFA